MKGINLIDKVEVEITNDGKVKEVAWKGHIERIKVIEVNDFEREFLSHRFSSDTLKNMFFAQFEIDYCGG